MDDHCDDHSHIIGIRDELIYTMGSGLRLSHVTEGVQTREKMIVRWEFHIFLNLLCFVACSVRVCREVDVQLQCNSYLPSMRWKMVSLVFELTSYE